MVDVLPNNLWSSRMSFMSSRSLSTVGKLCGLALQTFLDIVIVAVLELAMLYTFQIVVVLLREHFPILHWLD